MNLLCRKFLVFLKFYFIPCHILTKSIVCKEIWAFSLLILLILPAFLQLQILHFSITDHQSQLLIYSSAVLGITLYFCNHLCLQQLYSSVGKLVLLWLLDFNIFYKVKIIFEDRTTLHPMLVSNWMKMLLWQHLWCMSCFVLYVKMPVLAIQLQTEQFCLRSLWHMHA